MHQVLTFLLAFGTWIIFSGLLDPFHLTLGLISALIIARFSSDLLFQDTQKPLAFRLKMVFPAICYFLWLIWEIFLANLHVFRLAFQPNVNKNLDPQTIRFKTILKTDFARYVLANSITLTPGTVTVRIEGDEFVVHAISEKTAAGVPGEMENKVMQAFEKV